VKRYTISANSRYDAVNETENR